MSIINGNIFPSQWFNNGFNFNGIDNYIQQQNLDKVDDLTLCVFINMEFP